MVKTWQAAIPIVILYCCLQPAFISAIQSHHPQASPKYLKFTHSASDFFPNQEYDYIIVGGGTAGCPLAATLSSNLSVLLLERGGNPNVNDFRQENFAANILQANHKDSPVQAFTSEDGIPNARGRVLGGSSMINAGIYTRADESFYAESGLDWDMDDVDKAYQWVEETVAFRPFDEDLWKSSVKEAFVEAGLGPYNGYTVKQMPGVKFTATIFDENGTRHGSVEHLNRANPENLQVVVNATVEKVIFSSSRASVLSAVGVIYRDFNGKSYQVQVHKNGEVILSAGALGSPQLLLLSGIGPKQDLSSLDIPVVQDQQFVGKYISDNPKNAVSIISPFRLISTRVIVIGTTNGSYIEPQSSIDPFFSPISDFIRYPRLAGSPTLDLSVLVISEKLSRPLSTGSLRLASAIDFSLNPIVRFNYFSNPIDMRQCVVEVKNIGEMLATPAMEPYKFRDRRGKEYFKFAAYPLPEDLNDVTKMEDYCNNTLATFWHYHGGCLVGKLVDRHVNFIGIEALRVVDGSIFRVSPGANPQATVMMMGRYVGLKILEQRFSKGAKSMK